jgi:hypothetical protein
MRTTVGQLRISALFRLMHRLQPRDLQGDLLANLIMKFRAQFSTAGPSIDV